MSPNGGLFYFARLFPPLLTHINTYTIGFGYFVNLENSVFDLVFPLFADGPKLRLFGKTGFQFGRMHQKGGGWGDPLVQWQCMGALFVFVGWGLWTARRHLKVGFQEGRGMMTPMWMMRVSFFPTARL